jgi:hypothetical protein
MIVNRTIITASQISAGRNAMSDEFSTGAVVHALRQAGVATKNGLVMDAASRIVSQACDAGSVKRIGEGRYRRVR